MAIVAIIGKQNVGKSTLFNRLIRKRIAIVDNVPGITRDRNYAQTDWAGYKFTVVDTGGLIPSATTGIEAEVKKQAEIAINEADIILLVVDAKTGIDYEDKEVANLIRKSNKTVLVVVNKVDNPKKESAVHEAYALGLGDPHPVSAIHGTGINSLLDKIVNLLPVEPEEEKKAEFSENLIKISFVGRPNVGKSSLINFILGEERCIVTPNPGTTRDAIDTMFTYKDQQFLLIDTAGIRRKSRITYGVETYSVLRALRSVIRADVCALVLDALEGVTSQDMKIAGYIEQVGSGIVLVANKWDLVEKEAQRQKKNIKSLFAEFEQYIHSKLDFVNYAPVIFVSALTGERVLQILDLVKAVNLERKKTIASSELNEFLTQAIEKYPPPTTSAGKHIRIRSITQVQTAPPKFAIFCNYPKELPETYLRYLENSIRRSFGFTGTPIKFQVRLAKKKKKKS